MSPHTLSGPELDELVAGHRRRCRTALTEATRKLRRVRSQAKRLELERDAGELGLKAAHVERDRLLNDPLA